ncbi:leucine-rich repeat-containing protein 4C-like [Homarus americanus]|uniref:leucine-rich repeat-containing protein 4C-like n=1 Tax=Homarus americanus TaxID=6706 RepID=UPI001C474D67|nr:leucine-rich repeat-containing protein 4C-like [Homarus americanus]
MASMWWSGGVLVVVMVLRLATASTCPSVCTCRWKNGKQAVECRNQGLINVPDGIEPDTQVLDLSGNNLQTLPRHAFKRAGLINLQKIYLRDCKIGQIDPTAFFQLTNLVELDLSENLLTEVPSLSFSHIQALRDLQLQGNRFRKIRGDSFAHTPSLVRLDLSRAGIRNVSPSAFQSLSLMEKLEIQGNQLSELPPAVVKNLERVHGLQVHGNPWLCDCRSLPLWRLLEEKRVPHPVSPSCTAPSRVKGKTFHTLTQEDFACPPQILPIVRLVEGVAGENATIACPVGGQPPPQVMWYKGEAPVVNGSVIGLGPQRLYVIQEGDRNLISRLVITGAQETDSGTLRCVAINSAGSATANFTLAVTMRAATQAKLDSGHIAGISVGLVVLALIVLVVGFLVLARARSNSSPTPVKDSPTTPSSEEASPSEPNPVQKPPRLTDLNGSPGAYGSSTLGNPDVISEAERAVRAVNGHLPNGSIQGVSEGGDYTRVEGDSLYPSGLWPEDAPPQEPLDNTDPSKIIHEHFNPGYLANDPGYDGYGPVHSTPYRPGYESQEDFDPQNYGYPADYGLPIPEAGHEREPRGAVPGATDWSMVDLHGAREGVDSRADTYASRQDMYASQQDVYSTRQDLKDSRQDLYGVTKGRPPVYGYRQEVYGSREDVAEGAESPQGPAGPLGERPWVPGSQAPPLARGGVAVLPPLPNGIASRIKARDSPDEGYQEGTEV